MPLITIREARKEDLDKVLDVFEGTVRFVCNADYSLTQIEAWLNAGRDRARWAKAMKDQYFLVAEFDNELVGFGSLQGSNYLDFLYVHKDHQRKGIADMLYQQLKAKAEKNGHGRLTSDVSKTAMKFFQSKGFKLIHENRLEVNGVEVVNYHMSQ